MSINLSDIINEPHPSFRVIDNEPYFVDEKLVYEDTSGNVGIGFVGTGLNPSTNLHIYNKDGDAISLKLQNGTSRTFETLLDASGNTTLTPSGTLRINGSRIGIKRTPTNYNLEVEDSFAIRDGTATHFYATTIGAGLGDDKPFIWGLNNDFNAQYSSSLDALIVSNGTGVATAPYLYLWENKVGIGRKPNTASLEVEDSFRLANGTDLLFELTANGMVLDEDEPIVMGEGRDCYLGWNGYNFYMGLGSDFGANDRFAMNSSGNIVHYGYTYLGGDAPAIKFKKFTGTFPTSSTAIATLSLGFNKSKVLGWFGYVYAGGAYFSIGLGTTDAYCVFIQYDASASDKLNLYAFADSVKGKPYSITIIHTI